MSTGLSLMRDHFFAVLPVTGRQFFTAARGFSSRRLQSREKQEREQDGGGKVGRGHGIKSFFVNSIVRIRAMEVPVVFP